MHTLHPEIAEIVGANAAIIARNIEYWIDFNFRNEKNHHEGRYWTFNSQKAFSEQFTYMSLRQIEGCINKLKKKGLLLVGNYNKRSSDKTSWYSLTEEYYDLTKRAFPYHQMVVTHHRTVVTLPDSKQDSNKKEKLKQKDFAFVDSQENTTYVVEDKELAQPSPLVEDKESEPPAPKENHEQAVLDLFTSITGKKVKMTADRKKTIGARIKEGAHYEDFMQVILFKHLEWRNNVEMKHNIRPETLFRAKHFVAYCEQADVELEPIYMDILKKGAMPFGARYNHKDAKRILDLIKHIFTLKQNR